MIKKKFILLLLLAVPFFANACFHESFNDTARFKGFTRPRHFDLAALDKLIFQEELHGVHGWQDSIDHGVHLAKRGYVFRALNVFRELARAYPYSARVAANIGTVYDLAGMPDSALFWLRKEMELNPEFHMGTEWVHIRTLEAKIALAKDPDWLRTNRVLVRARMPVMTELSQAFDVMYQVERLMPLRIPPDPVFAAVLSELAEFQSSAGQLHLALLHCEYALEYSTGKEKPGSTCDPVVIGSLRRRYDSIPEAQRKPLIVKTELDKSSAYAVLDSEKPNGVLHRSPTPHGKEAHRRKSRSNRRDRK